MRDLSSKLGIKPGSTVCLIRPDRKILARIRQESDNVALIVDTMEEGCNVILYWVDPSEDIREKMSDLQNRIKPDGRIWVIIPKKEVCKRRGITIDWRRIQGEILKTQLVDNKVASINEEEYGTQFVIRKKYR